MEVAGAVAPEVVNRRFNLINGDYVQFIHDFRALLTEHEPPEIVAGHRVLPKLRQPKEPKRWICLELVGKENETTKLAVRDDNVYVQGFEVNKNWYELGFTPCNHNPDRCHAKKTASTMHGFHPTFLECDVGYSDLLQVDPGNESDSRARRKMLQLSLGKKPAIEAVGILSRYNQVDNGKFDTVTREALTTLILTFCEATRIIPIFKTVRRCWNNHGLTHVDVDESIYIWEWRNISAALLEWREEPKYTAWGTNHLTELIEKYPDARNQIVNISSSGEALDVVEVVLRRNTGKKQCLLSKKQCPVQWKDTNTAQGRMGFGRPLVEIVGVHADSAFIVRAIAVFDGTRGQIIYKDSGSQSQGMHDLALTGPYRAISAGGSFAIQLDGTIQLDGESTEISKDILWDCYSDKAEYYDKTWTDSITIGADNSIATVTYAVLSNAVEATVDVHLKGQCIAGSTARVHGAIMAHNEHLGDKRVVLFRRKEEEAVDIKVISSADITLPLARSVVAVPLDKPLLLIIQLEVALYAAYPPNNINIVSISEDMKISLLDHPTGKTVKGVLDLVVQVTSPHIYALQKHGERKPPPLAMTPFPCMRVDFDCCDGDYTELIGDLRKMLANHRDTASFHGRPVLVRQRVGDLVRWIEINLVGANNQNVTLDVRSDNLNLLRFKHQNNERVIFAIEGIDIQSLLGGETHKRFVQGAKPSTSKVTRKDISKALKSIFPSPKGGETLDMATSMTSMQLGRKSALDTIRKLNNRSKYNDQMGTRRALAVLMVMFCESVRILQIVKTVANGWEHKDGRKITKKQAQYIVNWSKMSSLLIGRPMRHSDWTSLRKIGINHHREAAQELYLLHNPPRHLLEVFGICGHYPTVSSFAIQDEIVVVYKHRPSDNASHQVSIESNTIDFPHDGTCRPILADGSIHIQIDDKVLPVELWECPTNHDRYHKALNHEIIIDDAVSTANLSYAVLYDAVEKGLKIHLYLKEHNAACINTTVYGKITATNVHLGGNSILLFHRTEVEGRHLEVTTKDDLQTGSVPLMRRSVAVPLDVPLVIKVKLFAKSHSNGNKLSLDSSLSFYANGNQTKMITGSGMDAQVMVSKMN